MIVEIAGKPAEHVKKQLSDHIMVLDKLKDVDVHTIKISEPKEIEANEEIKGTAYTCFAEADFEVETLGRLTELIFDFMPSSIEVIDPGNLKMNQAEATSLMNNISGRLHRYDEFAKVAGAKIRELEAKLAKVNAPTTQNSAPIQVSYADEKKEDESEEKTAEDSKKDNPTSEGEK